MNQTELLPKEERDVVFSACRTYRYALGICWDASTMPMVIIGLNPSTADELQDDPTIRRCKQFAKDCGHGSLIMVNLFAFRATDPKDMMEAKKPLGPANDFEIDRAADNAGIIVCAWGKHGSYMLRGEVVLTRLNKHKLYCFGTNGDSSPKHPLYLAKSVRPIPYNFPRENNEP